MCGVSEKSQVITQSIYTDPPTSLYPTHTQSAFNKSFQNLHLLIFFKYPSHSLSTPTPHLVYTQPTPSLYPTHTQPVFTQSFQKFNLPNFYQIPHIQSIYTHPTPSLYPTHTQSAFTQTHIVYLNPGVGWVQTRCGLGIDWVWGGCRQTMCGVSDKSQVNIIFENCELMQIRCGLGIDQVWGGYKQTI